MELEKWNSVPDSIFNSIVTQIDSFLGGRDLPNVPQVSAEAQISLLQQLHDLYSEIEAAGGRRPRALAQDNEQLVHQIRTLRQQIEGFQAALKQGGAGVASTFGKIHGEGGLNEQLASLYAEIEEAGGRRPVELRAMCDQLVEQLSVIYKEIEDAGGQRPLEARELITSLVEQLHALYGEREQANDVSNSVSTEQDSLLEQLCCLYAEKEDDQRDAMIESLCEQLAEFYNQREHGEDTTLVDSLLAQLHDLYADREHNQTDVIDSLTAQLADLYNDREHSADNQVVLDSFTAQLADLYAEKEEREAVFGAAGFSVNQAEAVIEGLNAQLTDLYAEREAQCDLPSIVHQLERQLAAFVEDKLELEAELTQLNAQLNHVRERARRMTAALTESALA